MGRFGCFNTTAFPEARINSSLAPQAVGEMLEDYERTGFGFIPNKGTPDYGSAWTSPKWFFDQFGKNSGVVHLLFQEKGWDNFQDAYAYLKAPINEIARSRM